MYIIALRRLMKRKMIHKTFSQLHAERAARRARQDYINGEKLQHALGWKGSSDFGPKPQAASAMKKTQLKDKIKT